MAEQQIAILIRAKDEASKVLRDISNQTKEMSTTFKQAGVAMLGVSTALAATLGFAVKSGAEEEAGIRRLSVAMRNAGLSYDNARVGLEAWIAAQQEKTAVSDEAQRESLATLIPMTNDLAEAQRLMSLAMDISAGTGRDLSSATQMVQYALSGNWGILERYIPALKGAANEQDKWNTLQQIFADQAEEYGNTLKGQWDIMIQNVNDLKEAVGSALTSTVQPWIKMLADWFDGMSKIPPETMKLITQIGLLTVGITGAVGATFLFIGHIPNLLNLLAALNGALRMVGFSAGVLPIAFAAAGVAMIAAGLAMFKYNQEIKSMQIQIDGAVDRLNILTKALQDAEKAGDTEKYEKLLTVWEQEKAAAEKLGIVIEGVGFQHKKAAKDAWEGWSEAALKIIADFQKIESSWNFGRGVAGTPAWYRSRGQAGLASWLEQIQAMQAEAVGIQEKYYAGEISQKEWDAFWAAYNAFAATRPDVEAFEAAAGLGSLASYQHGGVVPGPAGAPVPVIAHGGERFLGEGGFSPVINLNVRVYLSERELKDVILERMALDYRLQGGM